MASPRKAVVVAVSGCSSSGKSTLSRLLCDVFPNCFVLHADDFYKPEAEIPTKDGVLDWDCADALSIPDMIRSLEYIHRNGTYPPDLHSKEAQNPSTPPPAIPSTLLSTLRSQVQAWSSSAGHSLLSPSPLPIFILDGFLLYAQSMAALQPQLDIRLFLRTSEEQAKKRRAKRAGYATLEGFWEDPPGYVENIVWPNYVRDHAFLFKDGDVEGEVDEAVMREHGIECLGKGDVDMATTVEWAVNVLMRRLPEVIGERGQ